jgi:hypothetical protein
VAAQSEFAGKGTFHRSAALPPRKRELRVGQMGRAEQYRWFAVRCLEIARTTLDPQTKAAMLQMAQVWSRLADESESVRNEPPSGCR